MSTHILHSPAAGEFIRTDAHEDTQVRVQLLRSNANDSSYQHKPTHLQLHVQTAHNGSLM